MKQTIEEQREIIKAFWDSITPKDRNRFLFFMKKEGVANRTLYTYAKKEFKLSGIIIRGLYVCLQEYRRHVKKYMLE